MLSDLMAEAAQDASARRALHSFAEVEAAATARESPIDALDALRPADRVKIIAEIKRASPSRGCLPRSPIRPPSPSPTRTAEPARSAS